MTAPVSSGQTHRPTCAASQRLFFTLAWAYLEATNLATGRGTDTPFERVGAPWIDPIPFAAALNASALPGMGFVPFISLPKERQHAGQRCGGVQYDHELVRFDPLCLGITLAVQLRLIIPRNGSPMD